MQWIMNKYEEFDKRIRMAIAEMEMKKIDSKILRFEMYGHFATIILERKQGVEWTRENIIIRSL